MCENLPLLVVIRSCNPEYGVRQNSELKTLNFFGHVCYILGKVNYVSAFGEMGRWVVVLQVAVDLC